MYQCCWCCICKCGEHTAAAHAQLVAVAPLQVVAVALVQLVAVAPVQLVAVALVRLVAVAPVQLVAVAPFQLVAVALVQLVAVAPVQRLICLLDLPCLRSLQSAWYSIATVTQMASMQSGGIPQMA